MVADTKGHSAMHQHDEFMDLRHFVGAVRYEDLPQFKNGFTSSLEITRHSWTPEGPGSPNH